MKKNFLIFIGAIFICSPVFAQKLSEEQVPPAVKEKFQEKYKEVKVKWNKGDEGNFEGEFKQNKKKITVVFNTDGKWVETRTEVDYQQLPSDIITFVFEKYKGYEMITTEKVERANGLTYHLELEDNKAKKLAEITFDKNGIMQEQVVKDEK